MRRTAITVVLAMLAGLVVLATTGSAGAEDEPTPADGWMTGDGRFFPDRAAPSGDRAGAAFAGTLPPGPMPESVIGADGRTEVTNTTAYPARVVGTLTSTVGVTAHRCTAFLINANTVVSAAECIHAPSSNVTGTNFVFTPGATATTSPNGTCNGPANAVWRLGWSDSGTPEDNVGAVTFSCTLGNQLGWLGYAAQTDVALTDAPVSLRGYPDAAATPQYLSADQVRAQAPRFLYHQADVVGGTGAPLTRASGCNGPCVVGIQTDDIGGSPPGDVNNRAVRVEASVLGTLDFAISLSNPTKADLRARTSTQTTLVGSNVYNATGAGQSRTANVGNQGAATYVVNLQNDGVFGDFKLRGTASNSRFLVTYRRGAANITNQVVAGTYPVNDLSGAASVEIRVTVKARPGTPRNTKLAVLVTASPVGGPAARHDTVKLTTTRT